ncbi:protein SDA1, putative [Plasmodium yoelii]|uniref:Protein SDA1 n=2 Tax=Plasmodium yoelii TaxID=5861 RepID=A0AAE9WLP4_PLAYO|nr:protein SDA1, putative [Plasmodium yoelii]WBY56035.1 protein SDA1 [Plasmodium yoelii yoelii]CDU17016.1 large ribosomal subunit assembling factor, putative [Plasmodium yoelii]VTZ75406.1 protein SDA1, putative [Plasmodium yoelii]|eukprot:XP_022813176.1 protein SDA1, putative [Plasmodium yoelii]
MNDVKAKRQRVLNHLQHNIYKNADLYSTEFYEQFDKFLFNYSMLLLNPSKKNELLCSQLSFLCYTSHFFSKKKNEKKLKKVDAEKGLTNQNGINGESKEDGENGENGENDEKDESDIGNYSDISIDFGSSSDGYEDENRSCNVDANSDSSARCSNPLQNQDNIINLTNEGKNNCDINEEEIVFQKNIIENKKKEILNRLSEQAEENITLITQREEHNKNPLLLYNELNEYINLLMIKNKEDINYVEELYFLCCQLVIQYKNNLYPSILLSIVKTFKQIKKYIDYIKYIQILIYMSDISIHKIKGYIYKCVSNIVIYINKKTKDEKLKNSVLDLLHEAFAENSQRKIIKKKYSSNIDNFVYFKNIKINESINNFACSILIEMIKKNIYIQKKKNINIISEGIFYKNLKIVKCVAYALLGKYDIKEFSIKINKEIENKNKNIDELKSISNQTHQKMTKAKIKRLHLKKGKIMDELSNNKNSSDDEKDIYASNYVNYLFIDSLFDPYSFASKIFNIIYTKYRSNNNNNIKILLLNILCRIYQRYKIIEENFFIYFENTIYHLKNKNTLSKYLSIFIQSLHDDIPIQFVQRVVYVLIKKFLILNLSEEFVYLIINSIIEIIIKCPNSLNDEIFDSVLIFKDYKNKNISILIRRFINVAKNTNPHVMSKKLWDKKTAMLVQREKLLSTLPSTRHDQSLLQYSYLLDRASRGKRAREEEEAEVDEEEVDEEEVDEEEVDEEEVDEEEVDEEEVDEEEVDEEEVDEEEVDEEEADAEEEEADAEEEEADAEEEEADEEEVDEEEAEAEAEAGGKINGSRKKARREKKIKNELMIQKKNEEILSERILTDDDFKKLKKMKEYIENNKNIVLSELAEICNDEYEDDDDTDSDSEKEKIITEDQLLYKKKLKKKEIIKIKNTTNGESRFKTNKEKEKKKSVMMLMQKLKKKKSAITQYGKLKKKLKGKLAARAKKRQIINKRVAKKLSRRKR